MRNTSKLKKKSMNNHVNLSCFSSLNDFQTDIVLDLEILIAAIKKLRLHIAKFW